MTQDPGYDPEKKTEVCPYCKEEYGKEHKKTCGLWSPYSSSPWVKAKAEPAAALVSQGFMDRWKQDMGSRQGLSVKEWQARGLNIREIPFDAEGLDRLGGWYSYL